MVWKGYENKINIEIKTMELHSWVVYVIHVKVVISLPPLLSEKRKLAFFQWGQELYAHFLKNISILDQKFAIFDVKNPQNTTKSCPLCLQEKLEILCYENKFELINK